MMQLVFLQENLNHFSAKMSVDF